jgi:hypothetical protein
MKVFAHASSTGVGVASCRVIEMQHSVAAGVSARARSKSIAYELSAKSWAPPMRWAWVDDN